MLEKKVLDMAEKPHMNLVFIGHVDHGKSTSVGRLLLDTGHIEAHVIEKYRKEAETKGKATFEFAWVMDGLKEERERGLTIDVAHKRFNTAEVLLHDHRRARPQGLRQEHDHRYEPGRCGRHRRLGDRGPAGADEGAHIPRRGPWASSRSSSTSTRWTRSATSSRSTRRPRRPSPSS